MKILKSVTLSTIGAYIKVDCVYSIVNDKTGLVQADNLGRSSIIMISVKGDDELQKHVYAISKIMEQRLNQQNS